MEKYLYFLLLILTTTSCQLIGQHAFSKQADYINQEGYKNFYIVDTLMIDNPVLFYTKEGHPFVMSRTSFNLFKGSTSSLFKRNDAFLFDYDFPFHVPFNVYSSYLEKRSSACSEYVIRLPLEKRGISKIYSFSRMPDYFVLILIRGDYYNQVYASMDGNPIIRKDRNNYYKVVVPFCLNK